MNILIGEKIRLKNRNSYLIYVKTLEKNFTIIKKEKDLRDLIIELERCSRFKTPFRSLTLLSYKIRFIDSKSNTFKVEVTFDDEMINSIIKK